MFRFTFLQLVFQLFIVSSLIAQPKLEFDHTDHDFGEVIENTYPKALFKLYNTGNEPLKLLEVKTSCGCTTPHWPKEEVLPGDSNQIEVVFNSRGYSNRDFAKSIVITYDTDNKGTSKVVVLYIHGKVIPKKKPAPQYPLVIKEKTIDFGYIRSGKDKSYSLEIVNEGDSTIEITGFKSSCDACMSIDGLPVKIPPRDKIVLSLLYHGRTHEPRTILEDLQILTSLDEKYLEEFSGKKLKIVGEVLDKKTYRAKTKEN